jgi:hypothetical protein
VNRSGWRAEAAFVVGGEHFDQGGLADGGGAVDDDAAAGAGCLAGVGAHPPVDLVVDPPHLFGPHDHQRAVVVLAGFVEVGPLGGG